MSVEFEKAREEMVATQLRNRGVRDPALLAAFRRVPRHRFVPESQWRHAYEDRALPIACGQTISQPLMVARMLEEVAPRPGERALEVGTGLGYQAAILWELTGSVVSLERIASLAEEARRRLDAAGYREVRVLNRDGRLGFPEEAPFDIILVAAGSPRIPAALPNQLADHGRLVIPVGDPRGQALEILTRCGSSLQTATADPCLFVPLLEGIDRTEPE